jgi:hypothetical protein
MKQPSEQIRLICIRTGGKNMLVCLTSNDFSSQNSFLQTNVVVLLGAQGSHQSGTNCYAMPYRSVDEPISLQLPSLVHLESALLHS